MTSRPLRVFLCHSSNDKPVVRELYQKLRAEPWIQPWLDEEELYPGQDWNMEIEKAVEAADVIIVCLSNNSINKEGYVQKEIKIALDYADYKPEGTVFIIPVRLEECIPPKRLARWQYADYLNGQRERALQRLLVSLRRRADSLDIKIDIEKELAWQWLNERTSRYKMSVSRNKLTLSNGMEFMRVPAGKFLMGNEKYHSEMPQHTVDIPYDYWTARFPVTNDLYDVYVKLKGINHPVFEWEKKKNHPVTSVSWYEVMAYCQWLNNLLKTELPTGLTLRLPTENEWEKAARGTDAREYPWGNEFDENKLNFRKDWKGAIASVDLYSPQGDSPYGCADMLGNVWEWTYSIYKEYPYNSADGREDSKAVGNRVWRGGAYGYHDRPLCCAMRSNHNPNGGNGFVVGFRVCVAPPLPK